MCVCHYFYCQARYAGFCRMTVLLHRLRGLPHAWRRIDTVPIRPVVRKAASQHQASQGVSQSTSSQSAAQSIGQSIIQMQSALSCGCWYSIREDATSLKASQQSRRRCLTRSRLKAWGTTQIFKASACSSLSSRKVIFLG